MKHRILPVNVDANIHVSFDDDFEILRLVRQDTGVIVLENTPEITTIYSPKTQGLTFYHAKRDVPSSPIMIMQSDDAQYKP